MDSQSTSSVGVAGDPDPGHAGLRRVLGGLVEPVPALALACCGLMMFACVTNGQLGPWAVAFKHTYTQLFMLFATVLAGRRIADVRSAWFTAARFAWCATPLFLAFCALIGIHGLVSNGIDYQAMASDYWNTDPFPSTSRRIGMPALAHLLGFEGQLYTVFWYAVLAAAFWAAAHLLMRRGLTRFETLSLTTSSILAYALVGPGYGEVAVLLLGIVLLRVTTTPVEKAVAAAFMIATHETATPFIAATLILAADARERREWLAIFGLLYVAFVASFLITWRDSLGTALLRASKGNVSDEVTSLQWLARHPLRALAGALDAYKLYWLPLLVALIRGDARLMAALATAALALVFVGTDTSRLVQFGSLPLFLAVTAELARWPSSSRRLLAAGNLLVPSIYIATNAGLLWGPGLYSLYLRTAGDLGGPLGRIFWN